MRDGSDWVAHCPAPAYAVGPEGAIVAWNDAATRLLGWAAGAVVGRPATVIDASTPIRLDRFHHDIAARTGDGPAGIDLDLRHRDGTTVAAHIDAGTSAEADGGAVVVGVIGALAAASADAEAARREVERLRALMLNVSDTIAVLDPDGRVAFLGGNPGGTLGFEDAELEGVNAFERLHPDDAERIAELWLGMLREPGSQIRAEFRAGNASGGWEYADATAVNLVHDPLIGGIVLTSRNISDRKRDELLLAAQASTLARLIEGAPTTVVLETALSAVAQILPGALTAVVGADPAELLADPVPAVPDGYRRAVESWADTGAVAPGAGTVVLTHDDTEPHAGELDPVLRHHGYRCSWVVPLTAAAGERLLGHLLVHLPAVRPPQARDAKVLDTVRGLASIAIEHGRAEWLAREALYDPLTGLPNRTLVLDRLRRALRKLQREGAVVALVFFDLDNFKVINDSLGHAAGDELLRAVARRLERAVRPGDTVGRLGGDEFVVLCESLADDDVVGVAARLADSFSQPFLLEHTERFATASFGIAVARRPDDDPESLLRDADAAMYQAKERGRARYEVFDESMRVRALERLSLVTRLRSAAARGEFLLHYQPTIDLASGAVVGAEALLRWQRHETSLVPAGDFIDLAESTGVIADLAPWLFQEVCGQVRLWSAGRNGGHPLSVAINLSARQLSDPHLVDCLAEAIDTAGIDAAAICIEFTEGILLGDDGRIAGVLSALKDLGVRLAIDDFGTGHSSLNHLKRLPIDVIKVDRSLVGGLGTDHVDTRIVAAVIDLAHSLAVQVVAEGVETEEQHAALVELGCDVAQGHYWSTAVPGPELARMLTGTSG